VFDDDFLVMLLHFYFRLGRMGATWEKLPLDVQNSILEAIKDKHKGMNSQEIGSLLQR
jgi:hypothetical protein